MATHHPSPPGGMNIHHGPPSGPPPPGMAPQQQQWPAAQQQMAAMNEAVWLQIGEPRHVQIKERLVTDTTTQGALQSFWETWTKLWLLMSTHCVPTQDPFPL
jgi:hypothetical protein